MKPFVLAALIVAVIFISVSATWFIMESQFSESNGEKINTENTQNAEAISGAMGSGKVMINIEESKERD